MSTQLSHLKRQLKPSSKCEVDAVRLSPDVCLEKVRSAIDTLISRKEGIDKLHKRINYGQERHPKVPDDCTVKEKSTKVANPFIVGLENRHRKQREYMEERKPLSAAKAVEMMGSKNKRETNVMNTLRRKNKIIGIEFENAFYYPDFQFTIVDSPECLAPHPLIERLLERLPKETNHWDVAYWFTEPKIELDRMTGEEYILNMPGNIVDEERYKKLESAFIEEFCEPCPVM